MGVPHIPVSVIMPMTPLSTHDTSVLDTISNRLKTVGTILGKWFSENYMKLNEEKCHFKIFGDKVKDSVVVIGKSLPLKKVKTKNFWASLLKKS